MMPEVDRAAANRAAVAARRARAELKRRLREGEISALRALELAHGKPAHTAAATLRVTDFLQSLPAIGKVKAYRVLEDLKISSRKRLGGLGPQQRQRLFDWLNLREGVKGKSSRLTVLAGPTAVGKGTVVKRLLEKYPNVKLSVSATTRKPRPGEVEGVDYYFVNDQTFDRMLANDELLEWATVHRVHRYGTPRGPVYDAAAAGKLVLLEIDLQGARQVRLAEKTAQLVFLEPPTWEELVRRLTERGTEDESERKRRLATAKVEIAAADEFDAVIVNDDVERAVDELYQVMQGNRE